MNNYKMIKTYLENYFKDRTKKYIYLDTVLKRLKIDDTIIQKELQEIIEKLKKIYLIHETIKSEKTNDGKIIPSKTYRKLRIYNNKQAIKSP